jgi:hypothetical protein
MPIIMRKHQAQTRYVNSEPGKAYTAYSGLGTQIA